MKGTYKKHTNPNVGAWLEKKLGAFDSYEEYKNRPAAR